LVLTNNFTIEAWVYPTGTGNATYGGVVVGKEGEYMLARYPDGSIRWAFANNSPGCVAGRTNGRQSWPLGKGPGERRVNQTGRQCECRP